MFVCCLTFIEHMSPHPSFFPLICLFCLIIGVPDFILCYYCSFLGAFASLGEEVIYQSRHIGSSAHCHAINLEKRGRMGWTTSRLVMHTMSLGTSGTECIKPATSLDFYCCI